MSTIKRFEEIEAWKNARELNKDFSALIKQGRLGKNYRLINQIQGSLGSIMDNIAEGFERGSRKEFINFLSYSKGSCGEFRSQVYRCFDEKSISEKEFYMFIDRSKYISVLLYKFIKHLLLSDEPGIQRPFQPGAQKD